VVCDNRGVADAAALLEVEAPAGSGPGGADGQTPRQKAARLRAVEAQRASDPYELPRMRRGGDPQRRGEMSGAYSSARSLAAEVGVDVKIVAAVDREARSRVEAGEQAVDVYLDLAGAAERRSRAADEREAELFDEAIVAQEARREERRVWRHCAARRAYWFGRWGELRGLLVEESMAQGRVDVTVALVSGYV
jgi:hypothetical protein